MHNPWTEKRPRINHWTQLHKFGALSRIPAVLVHKFYTCDTPSFFTYLIIWQSTPIASRISPHTNLLNGSIAWYRGNTYYRDDCDQLATAHWRIPTKKSLVNLPVTDSAFAQSIPVDTCWGPITTMTTNMTVHDINRERTIGRRTQCCQNKFQWVCSRRLMSNITHTTVRQRPAKFEGMFRCVAQSLWTAYGKRLQNLESCEECSACEPFKVRQNYL